MSSKVIHSQPHTGLHPSQCVLLKPYRVQSLMYHAICPLVSTNCVLKNGNNCGTSVHLINFTVCNRSLVTVLVRHWAATTQSSSTVFELDIQDLQTLIY